MKLTIKRSILVEAVKKVLKQRRMTPLDLSQLKIGKKVFIDLQNRDEDNKYIDQKFWGKITRLKGNQVLVKVNTYVKQVYVPGTDNPKYLGYDGKVLSKNQFFDKNVSFYQTFSVQDLEDLEKMERDSYSRGIQGAGHHYNSQTDKLQFPPEDDIEL